MDCVASGQEASRKTLVSGPVPLASCKPITCKSTSGLAARESDQAEHSQATRDTGSPGPFERLLKRREWLELPLEVRRRFEAAPSGSHPKMYAGRVVETRLSSAGRVLARLAGLFGTPLPETHGAVGPASVTIAWNEKLSGQIWTRVYGRPGRFPQVVHSVKRFAGPTGLEEFVGPGANWGIGMTLRLSVEAGVLTFRSDHYFVSLGRFRLNLPRWCEPGAMTIRHQQLSGPEFHFILDLEHPWFGSLIHQKCIFSDCQSE